MDEVTDLARIQELSVTGRYQECLQACRNILRINAEESYVYQYKGKSLLALGQFHEAKNSLLKAYQLDDSDPEIPKDIGNSFLKMGDTVNALIWYEIALKVCSTYAPAINNIANIKREDECFEEAIKLYKRAIQSDPNLTQAYFGAAATFIELGDYDQAEAFACKVLATDERVVGINEILGIIYQNKSNTDKAIECYRKELEHNPIAIASLSNLGFLLLQKGEMVTAVESLEKVSVLAPTDRNSLLLAQSYQALGKFNDAICQYKQLSEKQLSNKIILFNLGICFFEIRQFHDAIGSFQEAVRLDSCYFDALTYLASALTQERRYEEALEATLVTHRLMPMSADIYLSLGCIYRELGKLDKALDSVRESLNLDSENSKAFVYLGAIYKDLGCLDKALVSVVKSLELNPANSGTQLLLGSIYKDLGHNEKAIACLSNILRGDEVLEEAALMLAGIYYHQGSYESAIQALNGLNSKDALNFLLSLRLCVNDKGKFDLCAYDLIAKGWLNQRGIAALNHASVFYGQFSGYSQSLDTLNSVTVENIGSNEFSDVFLGEILHYLSSGALQSRSQGYLFNGAQTSGNILDIPLEPFFRLKCLLLDKLKIYNRTCDICTDKEFDANWSKGLYALNGWAIVMKKGGFLKPHNHETSWISGTFYLQVPKRDTFSNEGAIEFSYQGPCYPGNKLSFEKKCLCPVSRDLNIFSSSLFHQTIPFDSSVQRICIAFDLKRR